MCIDRFLLEFMYLDFSGLILVSIENLCFYLIVMDESFIRFCALNGNKKYLDKVEIHI